MDPPHHPSESGCTSANSPDTPRVDGRQAPQQHHREMEYKHGCVGPVPQQKGPTSLIKRRNGRPSTQHPQHMAMERERPPPRLAQRRPPAFYPETQPGRTCTNRDQDRRVPYERDAPPTPAPLGLGLHSLLLDMERGSQEGLIRILRHVCLYQGAMHSVSTTQRLMRKDELSPSDGPSSPLWPLTSHARK